MASDIFNTTVPAWYAAVARPPDSRRYGQLIGTALGGGLIAATEGKSFGEGVAEARMNQVNPMWKLDAAAKEAQITSDMARAQSVFSLANMKTQEEQAWMEDAPRVASWRNQPLEARMETTPEVNSQKGLKAVLDGQKADIVALKYQNATESEKQRVKQISEQNRVAGVLPPEVMGRIKNMTANQDGTWSTEQVQLANAWLTGPGKRNPMGFKSTDVSPFAMQEAKHEDRMEEIKARGSYGRATASLAEVERLDEWGKKVTEAKAAGNDAEAKRYEDMIRNLKAIKNIPEGDNEPKITQMGGHTFIQFPGYAPKELKNKADEFMIKAMLHDYYNNADIIKELKSYSSLTKQQRDQLRKAEEEAVSLFGVISDFRGAPIAQPPKASPAAPSGNKVRRYNPATDSFE